MSICQGTQRTASSHHEEGYGTDSLLEGPERIFANFPPPEMLFKPRKERKRYKLRERERERERKKKGKKGRKLNGI